MTDFTDIKLKINGIIDKNKKIYFDSKTISDIEEFGDTKEEQKIMKLAFIPSVLFSTIFFTSISFSIAKFFFIMSSETWFLTLSLSMFFSFILSLFIYNKKDIEDKRISIGIDFIKSSDIKDNVLVI